MQLATEFMYLMKLLLQFTEVGSKQLLLLSLFFFLSVLSCNGTSHPSLYP